MQHATVLCKAQSIGYRLINVDRAQVGLVIGLITGHWTIAKHLTDIGMMNHVLNISHWKKPCCMCSSTVGAPI